MIDFGRRLTVDINRYKRVRYSGVSLYLGLLRAIDFETRLTIDVNRYKRVRYSGVSLYL